MQRRDFIKAIAGSAAAWALAARAQQPERMRRIGMLIGVAESDTETQTWAATFRKPLDDLGWRVGRNLQIDERWSASDPDQIRVFAGELVAMKPDAIFAFSSVVVAALLRESRTIPIVFTAISDPLGSGFVASLAHPGGNATGFTNFVSTMGTKWLRCSRRSHRGSGGQSCCSTRKRPPTWLNIIRDRSRPRRRRPWRQG